MERYRCMDCGGPILWYDAVILGRSRCSLCQEAHDLCVAMDRQAAAAQDVIREAAAHGIADEAIIEQQITVPLHIQRALEELTSPFAEFGLHDLPSLAASDRSHSTPPRRDADQEVKLQPVLLELEMGRLECGRCGALAILVRLRHGAACDDPRLFEYQALCQACWRRADADDEQESERAG